MRKILILILKWNLATKTTLKLLSTLEVNTATGPDGLSSRMLRATATSCASSLTDIFNCSLTHSVVPNQLKVSFITPIPKSGDPSSVTNYRPISLLSLPSKILENIVSSRISDFLYSNGLLSDCQFGFRPRSSTQEALLAVSDFWHKSLCKHNQVAAVFIDIRKAFDSVPHDLFDH